jgi:hypothetical protein
LRSRRAKINGRLSRIIGANQRQGRRRDSCDLCVGQLQPVSGSMGPRTTAASAVGSVADRTMSSACLMNAGVRSPRRGKPNCRLGATSPVTHAVYFGNNLLHRPLFSGQKKGSNERIIHALAGVQRSLRRKIMRGAGICRNFAIICQITHLPLKVCKNGKWPGARS